MPARFTFAILIAALGSNLVTGSLAQDAPPATTNSVDDPIPPAALTGTVVLPESVPDPIEPINRGMWAFNNAIMSALVKPTAKAYRFAIVKPVRTGISNFGRNIT